MQYIEQTITGIDGTTARFIGYVPDNSPEVVPDRTRPTVLIVPGGGYEMTSDREGEPIALQFLAADCNAFVLRYSCAPSVYPTALLEVAEAMRLILDNAEAWHVDPARIAVLGFSAGGHLAADFATSASDSVLRAHGYDPALLAPAALMLAYPVVTSGEYRHDGSFRALLGKIIRNTSIIITTNNIGIIKEASIVILPLIFFSHLPLMNFQIFFSLFILSKHPLLFLKIKMVQKEMFHLSSYFSPTTLRRTLLPAKTTKKEFLFHPLLPLQSVYFLSPTRHLFPTLPY